jgi:hypothetical protein
MKAMELAHASSAAPDKNSHSPHGLAFWVRITVPQALASPRHIAPAFALSKDDEVVQRIAPHGVSFSVLLRRFHLWLFIRGSAHDWQT